MSVPSAPLPADTLRTQTMTLRAKLAELIRAEITRAETIPPGWKNNLRWHAGHLVVTPRLLTYKLLAEDLGVPQDYVRWFGKGTSPADWKDGDEIPATEQLVEEMTTKSEELFDRMNGREGQQFPEAYTTSVGIVLRTPSDSLSMSYMHDGIHLGLVLALRRALLG